MQPLKDSFSFYFKNIHYLFLLSLTIVIPFLLFAIFVINYVYFIYEGTLYSFIGDIANGYLLFIFFIFLQIPFARFVYCDLEGMEDRMRQSYLTFLEYGFSVFLFAIIFATAVIVGSLLIIIPGVFLLVVLYLTPYVTAFTNQSTKHTWKKAYTLGKKHFFPLLLLIIITSSLQYGLSVAGVMGVTYFTVHYGAVFTIQLLINMIIFPFTVILISMYFLKWRNER